jgi:hypothetical protein
MVGNPHILVGGGKHSWVFQFLIKTSWLSGAEKSHKQPQENWHGIQTNEWALVTCHAIFFHTFRLNTLRSSNMAGRKTTAKGGCNPWRIQYIQLSNSNICPYVLRNLCIFWVKQIYLFFRIRWFWGILEPSIAKCVISTYIPQFSTWTWIIFHTCPLSQAIFSGRFWTCIFHLQVQFQLFQ